MEKEKLSRAQSLQCLQMPHVLMITMALHGGECLAGLVYEKQLPCPHQPLTVWDRKKASQLGVSSHFCKVYMVKQSGAKATLVKVTTDAKPAAQPETAPLSCSTASPVRAESA
jgi:hypothetical protein